MCTHLYYSSWARPCQPTSACPLQHGAGGRVQQPSNQPWTKPISRHAKASRTTTATSPGAPRGPMKMPRNPTCAGGARQCTIGRGIPWHLQGPPVCSWAGRRGCSGRPQMSADGFGPWLDAGSLYSAPSTMLQGTQMSVGTVSPSLNNTGVYTYTAGHSLFFFTIQNPYLDTGLWRIVCGAAVLSLNSAAVRATCDARVDRARTKPYPDTRYAG